MVYLQLLPRHVKIFKFTENFHHNPHVGDLGMYVVLEKRTIMIMYKNCQEFSMPCRTIEKY